MDLPEFLDKPWYGVGERRPGDANCANWIPGWVPSCPEPPAGPIGAASALYDVEEAALPPLAGVTVDTTTTTSTTDEDEPPKPPPGALAYHPTSVEPHCSLILLLHGLNGWPGEREFPIIAQSFAAAGFRVLAVGWNADLPLDACCTSLGATATVWSWDACLVSIRTERAREIEARAVAALEHLSLVRPGEGWEDYLEWGGLRWSRIIQAGYSSGANQSAFLARMFPVAGLILLAGGGDGRGPPPVCPLVGPAKSAWDPPPAQWMRSFVLPMDENHVGLTHVDENFELFEGWSLDGVPDRRLDFDSRSVAAYSDLWPATRLLRTDPVAGLNPHATSIDRGVGMNWVRMYLACKAGGLL